MGDRTSRTSPDMSILSAGLTTGQDKTPPYKGVCLSVVLSNSSEDQNLKNIPLTPARLNRERSVVIAARAPRIGKIERAVRRQLIIRKKLTTPQLAECVYGSAKHWQLYNVRRAAVKFCRPLYRKRVPGLPIVWQLKRPSA